MEKILTLVWVRDPGFWSINLDQNFLVLFLIRNLEQVVFVLVNIVPKDFLQSFFPKEPLQLNNDLP
jgi:hypothetical protein